MGRRRAADSNMSYRITHQPMSFDLHRAFPNAREVLRWEGGCAYAADHDGRAYVITDQRTLVDFLDADDADLADQLVTIREFDDMEDRDDHVHRRHLSSLPFERRIHTIYSAHARHILPFVGSAYEAARDNQLRVMALGINAYVDDKHWKPLEAHNWFRTWFKEKTHRFDKGVRDRVNELAGVVTASGRLFAGKRFDGDESLFITNVIKVYLTALDGKRADHVTHYFDEHPAQRHQWRDEFEALLGADVTPHVIAIFGNIFWPRICESFRKNGELAEHVKDYLPTPGPLLHFANRIVLKNGHELLLLRMRHPAARTKSGTAEWFVKQPGFSELVTPSK